MRPSSPHLQPWAVQLIPHGPHHLPTRYRVPTPPFRPSPLFTPHRLRTNIVGSRPPGPTWCRRTPTIGEGAKIPRSRLIRASPHATRPKPSKSSWMSYQWVTFPPAVANTQHPAPNIQHSIQHPAPSTQHPAQHPAPSTQHPAPSTSLPPLLDMHVSGGSCWTSPLPALPGRCHHNEREWLRSSIARC